MTKMVDVLIVGGGPAGSTAAALLAENGWHVVLLEKSLHPRFHIGESLLPGNLPILERLGVLEDVREIGVYKPGADFTGPDGNVLSFPFARALGDTPEHAFQVKRAEFDELLFANARRRGVDARERHQVTDVRQLGAYSEVDYLDADGRAGTLRATMVIDASGRESLMARKCGWQTRNSRHASAAIFGHFRNVTRRRDDLTGNISVYWFEHGWIWMIPLRDDVMSVGAVCWPSYLKQRDCKLEPFLRNILSSVPDACERMRDAVAVSPISATGNYSYQAKRLYDDGLLLVGDAYAFIDPVFSSGVYLAMNAAVQSIAPAEAWLRGERRVYRRSCRRYARAVRSKIGAFSWFIYRFTTPTMRDLFRNPRNDWQVEQAVISMLAGDGDGSADIRRRLRVFKTIYWAYRCRLLRESLRRWWMRRRNLRVAFTDETILN